VVATLAPNTETAGRGSYVDIAYDHCSGDYDAALASLRGALNLNEIDVLRVGEELAGCLSDRPVAAS
jgi:hypothetical protein